MSPGGAIGTVMERIEELSTDLFAAIPSQTSEADRRWLLAVQRATARVRGGFAYLEIGSHLGGSIQPYLLDPRCRAIFSIDARPGSQPDDRAPGYVAGYEHNSTDRMLRLLRDLAPDQVGKVRCFDADASEIDPAGISPRPHVAFRSASAALEERQGIIDGASASACTRSAIKIIATWGRLG